ncbi:hypothetical protein BUALT_Bualt09G0100600 [Buddleja alternifolia]|uniref:Uncharacterized protein n=1 Tax=Buddleja alternifolia TaxID=168488 RepID=A0AAV6X5R0_9LAMI|nr:hypothetical protein BUALT_Bualt09G0100600 [Buddleja alternifolia]
MSLHLGNLSSHIRRDDLERVFRRFGRCTIQVKDKYGFVVYDYPASAEKALKTLRGKRICGEAITLSWSKMQPRAPHGFARGGKVYEQPSRKQPMKEHVDRRLGSNNQRDFEMDFKQPDGEGRKLGSSDLIDESTSYHLDDSKAYVEGKDHTAANGRGGDGKNHLEDDRWGEQVVNPSSENLEFDRYEPYRSDDKKESDELNSRSPLAGSPATWKSQERRRTGQDDQLEKPDYRDNQKSLNTCYACGEVGHKRHMCPLRSKRHVSRSRGRLGAGTDASMMGQVSDREPLTSQNHGRLPRRGDSSPLQITPRGKRKEFKEKKRNRRDYKDEDQNHTKRAKAGPSFHSDYTLSRSQSPSKSLESLSQSPSHSKSLHLKKKSPSLSRSSTSRHSGHKPFKSISELRLMSPTFSPSPQKGQTDSKVSMVNAAGTGLAQSQDLFEGETMVRSGTGPAISENVTAVMENECEARLSILEEEGTKKDLSEKDDEHCHSVSRGSGDVLKSNVPQSDDGYHNADTLFHQSVKEMRDSQSVNLLEEHMLDPESDVSLRSNASNPATMSSEEICMVLKHYGLQYPEETEKDLPVEIYFGSARSWPWEIIYYRRLKKGPILAENYARRIAQNKEFGIVDKYIRSSSGWGDLNEGNP